LHLPSRPSLPMRAPAHAACLVVILAVLGAADDGVEAAAKSGADPDFDDLDDIDLDDEGEEQGMEQGQSEVPPETEKVDDFDLAIPGEDRKKRMKACFTHTMGRVQLRRQQLQETVQQMTMLRKNDMTAEQATNTLIFSWMMACYMNIDSSGIAQASQSRPLSEELEKNLFSQRTDRPQQVHQASPKQWDLLKSVLEEEGKKAPRKDPGMGMAGEEPGRAAGQSQYLYVLAVFFIIFGLGALSVYRLMQNEKAGHRSVDATERSAKSRRKAEKEEKKIAKKRI